MRITKEDIKERFKECNKLYFEGKLPIPKFGTYKGEQSVGLCYFDKQKKWINRITLARNVDWTEETLRSVLVHEMIHYLLGLRDGSSDSGHGRRFKAEAKRINEQYGLDITKRYPHIEFINAPKPPRTPWGKLRRWLGI